ncbi:hypothetical protein Phou_032510 [Phytohabitans houttuyneae]|uniref:Uncharacterized protein n=1 Tax=Phytohabitans houttuyneae TaxID=1076126 RepID=A0A6V8K9G7_9ACTN|nr:hypothetical protein Phou_032510 [Phytohabitans houttuyneae]
MAPQVARAIPDSRLLILDKVGHVAQMEVPRLVARAVVALLDEVRHPTARAPRASRAIRPAPLASAEEADSARQHPERKGNPQGPAQVAPA